MQFYYSKIARSHRRFCTAAHPLHTRCASVFGAAVSEAALQPDAVRRAAQSGDGPEVARLLAAGADPNALVVTQAAQLASDPGNFLCLRASPFLFKWRVV